MDGGGSRVVGGMDLQLHDGMAGEYITVLLNTSLKGWNARWFYMKQSHPAIRYDVDHIPKNQRSWSEKPSSANMEQVRELLGLIKGIKMNVVLVAASFIVLNYKERAHTGLDFKEMHWSSQNRACRVGRSLILVDLVDLAVCSFEQCGDLGIFWHLFKPGELIGGHSQVGT